MKQLVVSVLAIIGMTLICGCYTARVGDLTLAADEVTTIRTKVVKRNLTGEHCSVLWSGQNQPSIEKAIDQIHDQAESGAALQNVSIDYYIAPFYYVLIGKACYRVEADVVEILAE